MDRDELQQQWKRWVEANIGGPATRVETATLAAMTAVDQRKGRDEIVAAARHAADGWDRILGHIETSFEKPHKNLSDGVPQAVPATSANAVGNQTVQESTGGRPKLLGLFVGICILKESYSVFASGSVLANALQGTGIYSRFPNSRLSVLYVTHFFYLVMDLITIFILLWLWRGWKRRT
jgi:hypothetical protein